MQLKKVSLSDIEKLIQNFPAPVSPKGYRNFKEFYLDAVRVRIVSSEGSSKQEATTNKILIEMLKKKAPAYYLTDEIINAACNTNVPEISGKEIPFNNLNLFTPDGLCMAVNIVSTCECYNTEHLPAQLQEAADKSGVQIDTAGVEVMITAVIFADYHKYQGYATTELNLFPSSRKDKDLIFCSKNRIGYARDYDNCKIHRDMTVGQLTRLIANTIMLINYQPSLVTAQRSNSPGLGFNKKSSDEPMPVRWLGKNFSNSKTRSSTPSGGTHASPRAHWRRGHWHGYRYGEGRKTLKRKWVQPVYVNPQ